MTTNTFMDSWITPTSKPSVQGNSESSFPRGSVEFAQVLANCYDLEVRIRTFWSQEEGRRQFHARGTHGRPHIHLVNWMHANPWAVLIPDPGYQLYIEHLSMGLELQAPLQRAPDAVLERILVARRRLQLPTVYTRLTSLQREQELERPAPTTVRENDVAPDMLVTLDATNIIILAASSAKGAIDCSGIRTQHPWNLGKPGYLCR